MTLARAAAGRALDDIAAAPPVAAIPGSSAGAIAQAEERARHRTPDYGKLFAHLSRAVRQTILLEAAIVEGALPAFRDIATLRQAPRPPAAPSPDRDAIHPDTLRRETLERLDCALPDGPHGEIPVEDLLLTISEKFGLDRASPQTLGRYPAEPEAAPHPASPAPVRAAPDPPRRRPRW